MLDLGPNLISVIYKDDLRHVKLLLWSLDSLSTEQDNSSTSPTVWIKPGPSGTAPRSGALG